MSESEMATARKALHAVAELVLAGPQHRRSGTIRLRCLPGGFGTVTEPDLRIDGADLVAGSGRLPLTGMTIGALAVAAGVDAGAPVGLYRDGSGADPDDEINVDAAAATHLAACLAMGDAAMRRFAPTETPVLWPEHFDLGITVDAVNYGMSLGDTWLDEPYVYVGPWRRRAGAFWTAPFGATRPMRELDGVDAVESFLAEGRAHADHDPLAEPS